MSEEEDVKELLGRAFGQEPPLGIDRDQVLHQGRKRLRRRRVFEAGSVVAAVVIAAVGAATLTNLTDTEQDRIPPAASTTYPAPPGPDLPLTSGESPPVQSPTSVVLPPHLSEGDTAQKLTQMLYNSGVLDGEQLRPPPGDAGAPQFVLYGQQYILVADLIRPKLDLAGSLKVTVDFAPGVDAKCSDVPKPYLRCKERRADANLITVASMRDENGKRNYASTVARSGVRVTVLATNQTYANETTGVEPSGQPVLTEDELCVLVSKVGLGAF